MRFMQKTQSYGIYRSSISTFYRKIISKKKYLEANISCLILKKDDLFIL